MRAFYLATLIVLVVLFFASGISLFWAVLLLVAMYLHALALHLLIEK